MANPPARHYLLGVQAVDNGRRDGARRWELRVDNGDVDGIALRVLTGRIAHACARTLADAIGPARTPQRWLILDLAGVDYISSAGLRTLDEAAARCAAGRGALILVGTTDPVRIALDLAGVTPHVVLEATRDLAFARARATVTDPG